VRGNWYAYREGVGGTPAAWLRQRETLEAWWMKGEKGNKNKTNNK